MVDEQGSKLKVYVYETGQFSSGSDREAKTSTTRNGRHLGELTGA